MMTRRLLLGTMLAWAGCRFGPGVKAMGAAGTTVQLRMQSEGVMYFITGELLAVSPAGIFYLRRDTGRLTEVGYSSLLELTFENTDVHLRNGMAPTTQQLDRVRPYARYPQGLSPDLLRRLLDSYRQQEPDRLGQ